MTKLEICCLRWGYNDELRGHWQCCTTCGLEARNPWQYWTQQGDVDLAYAAYNRGRDIAKRMRA